MSRSLGTLTIDLIAKTGGFVSGMSKAEKEAEKRSKNIQKSLKQIGPVIASVAAAVVTSTALVVNELKNTSVEIDRLSRLSNSGTEEFQKLAYAADEYKISNEKLSDILKDVNDKVGDFIQTGGGPLKDFFDNIAPKVGVTADEFARLSGPEALQLYVDSLEKANLTQADMTFYMEAIANDATLLLPLLSEQGKRYKELADQAERYGVIIAEDVIKNSILLERQMKILETQFNGFKVQLGSEVLPTVTNLVDWMNHLAESGGYVDGVIDRLGDVFDVVSIAAVALTSTLENVGRALVGIYDAAGEAIVGNFSEAGQIIDDVTAKNEEAARKAEETIANIWNGTTPDTSTITTANDQIVNSIKTVTAVIDDSEKKRRESLRGAIDDINEMVATLGMTSAEVEIYKLRLMGASEAQIQLATDAYALRDAYETQEDATRKNKEAVDSQISSLNEMLATLGMTESQIDLYKLQMNGASDAQLQFAEDALAVKDAFDEQEKAAKEAQDAMKRSAEQFASNTQDIFADFLFDPFDKGLDGMLDSFANMLQRMAAEAAAAEIYQGLFGAGANSSNWFSSAASAIGGYFSGGADGARANGGPVMAGSMYQVGENNMPELLTMGNKQYIIPGDNGNVTPMHSSGGRGTQNFYITTPNPDAFRKSERQIKRELRSSM